MKFFDILLLSCSVVLLSCSRQSTLSSTPLNDDNDVISALTDFNDEMMLAYPQTKGLGSICSIVGSDFISGYEGAINGAKLGFRVGMVCGGRGLEGAIAGGSLMGLVCGIGGSYLAYATVSTKVVSSDDNLTPRLISAVERQYPNVESAEKTIDEGVLGSDRIILPEDSKHVGVLHNLVLDELVREDCPTVFDGKDLSDVEKEIISSEEFSQMATEKIDEYRLNGVALEISTLPDEVMSLYTTIFNNCADSYDAIVDCINGYYTIIETSSSLSDDEKNSIYAGLAVSLYSLNYWKNNGTFPQSI